VRGWVWNGVALRNHVDGVVDEDDFWEDVVDLKAVMMKMCKEHVRSRLASECDNRSEVKVRCGEIRCGGVCWTAHANRIHSRARSCSRRVNNESFALSVCRSHRQTWISCVAREACVGVRRNVETGLKA
jgi:hypothetical protein